MSEKKDKNTDFAVDESRMKGISKAVRGNVASRRRLRIAIIGCSLFCVIAFFLIFIPHGLGRGIQGPGGSIGWGSMDFEDMVLAFITDYPEAGYNKAIPLYYMRHVKHVVVLGVVTICSSLFYVLLVMHHRLGNLKLEILEGLRSISRESEDIPLDLKNSIPGRISIKPFAEFLLLALIIGVTVGALQGGLLNPKEIRRWYQPLFTFPNMLLVAGCLFFSFNVKKMLSVFLFTVTSYSCYIWAFLSVLFFMDRNNMRITDGLILFGAIQAGATLILLALIHYAVLIIRKKKGRQYKLEF